MQIPQRNYWPTNNPKIDGLIHELHELQMRRIKVNSKIYDEERKIEELDPGHPAQDLDGLRQYFLHMEGDALDVKIKQVDDQIQSLFKARKMLNSI